MNTLNLQNTVTELFCIVLSLNIMLHLNNRMGSLREVHILRALLSEYIVVVICSIMTMVILPVYHAPRIMAMSFTAAEEIGALWGCYSWLCYILIRINPSGSYGNREKLLMILPACIMTFLNLISIFTNWIFYVDTSLYPQVGQYFIIQRVITQIYIISTVIGCISFIIRTKSKEQKKEFLLYIIYIIIASALMIFEGLLPDIPIFVLGIYLVL